MSITNCFRDGQMENHVLNYDAVNCTWSKSIIVSKTNKNNNNSRSNNGEYKTGKIHVPILKAVLSGAWAEEHNDSSSPMVGPFKYNNLPKMVLHKIVNSLVFNSV